MNHKADELNGEHLIKFGISDAFYVKFYSIYHMLDAINTAVPFCFLMKSLHTCFISQFCSKSF